MLPRKIVYPSGAAAAASSAPICPPAPPRLSTTTCWPMSCESGWLMERARRSLPPPGGNGTIIRIGRVG